jgi:hypothetical protein
MQDLLNGLTATTAEDTSAVTTLITRQPRQT